MRALSGEVTPEVPVWLMRQAGRYLPEYRALRAKAGSFLNMCFTPDYAVEVTLQPIRRFGFDAAILFSDILVIPYALGQDLAFVEGEGPKLGAFDLDILGTAALHQKLAPVYETVKRLRHELSPQTALIGFAGAPWTVACYMLQGYGDGKFETALSFVRNNPAATKALIDILVDSTTEYLSAQITAGADAVQIFDSWAGLVSDRLEFETLVIDPARRIVTALRARHPSIRIIGFPRACGMYYADYARQTGVDALGLDPAADIQALPADICLQGNLAPEVLLAGGDTMRQKTLYILNSMQKRPCVFNLGHGVIKETPPEHVAALVSTVKGFRRDSR